MEARYDNLSILSRWMKDILLAVIFLTRLPVKLKEGTESPKLAEVIWAFPVVGVVVGAFASLVMLIGFQLGLDPLVCGLIAVAAQALITGALHEDGLADVADGFGGGNKVVDKLRIMRDSCVGTYGVLALVFSVTFRAGLIANMTTQTIAVLALISAGAVSRALVALAMNQLEIVRTDGLATGAGKPTNEATLVTLALGAAIAFLLLGASGWIVLVVTFGAAVMIGLFAKRQIGGQTGDVLGTVQQVTEATVLLSMVSVM
jgi:adenosylcobinamide-GDP ribazoletransferase